VLNVYAGYFSRFASQITVHNFTDKAGRYEARIYNAETGKPIGIVPLEISPRQSLTHPGVWYAGQAGSLSPIDDHPGLNIEFVAVEDTGARIVVAHNVRDVFSGTNVNLSNPCAIHGGLVSIFMETK